MKRESLTASKRSITGKQVKHLRRDGIVPANLYGKGIDSQALQLPLKDFQKVYDEVHETGLVDLTVEGGEKYPVLIKNVHIHPTTYEPLHADFFKVNLKEKVHATIPIIAVGEAKAVAEKVGVLLQTLNEVEVEALPTDLPESIEINIENLSNVDDSLTLADVKLPEGVEIMAEPTEMIFRIGELVSEEVEELAEQMEAEAEAAAEEAATEAAEEGVEKAEGEEEQKEETSEEESGEEKKAEEEKKEEN